MARPRSNRKRYNFLVDKALYDDFSLICNEMGLIRSRNIEKHLQHFIEQNSALLKELKKRGAK